MFGSQKTELTRKYDSNWFAAITFGFQSSSRRPYSQKPIAHEDERQRDRHAEAGTSTISRVQRTSRQQREQERERHEEEDDLLERRVEVLRVQRLERVQHHNAASAQRQRPGAGPSPSGAARSRSRAMRRRRSPGDDQRTAARAGWWCVPAASIGTRNGSTATTTSGSASGRRTRQTPQQADGQHGDRDQAGELGHGCR